MANPIDKDLRTQILLAAEELFIEKGYYGLSMREIAEAVGVSKAALYYHFKDKEELFLAILSVFLGEIEVLIDSVIRENRGARQRVRALVRAILLLPTKQRAVVRLASQESSHLSAEKHADFNRFYRQRFWGKIVAMLEEGMQAGELRKVDPALATWGLLGLMYPYFYPSRLGETPSVGAVIDPLVDLYLDGLGSSPAPGGETGSEE